MTSPARGGKKWMIRLGIGAGSGILLIALAVLGSVLGIDYLVDIWWFDALGYGFYYWQRMLYRYGVFAVVTLLFFLIFFSNFWIAARFLKKVPVEADAAGQSPQPQAAETFQEGIDLVLRSAVPGLEHSHCLAPFQALGKCLVLRFR
jgi:uncharacterized membrane protein (UPF0182 family)